MRPIALIACLALTLGAQPPPKERFQRSVLDLRTDFNGALHGNHLAIRLDTAMWVLMGEPVQDIAITWHWNVGAAGAGLDTIELGRIRSADGKEATLTVGDLRRQRPDLYRRFLALTPTRLEVPAQALFLDSADGSHPFAILPKTLRPDLIGPAGQPAPMHAPGSTSWARFFEAPVAGWRSTAYATKATHEAVQRLVDGPGASDPGTFNRTLYGLARRVQLRVHPQASVLTLEWPAVELRSLVEAYSQLPPKPGQNQGGQEVPKGPLQSLLLLIDVSGSMDTEGRLPAAKAAASKAARDAIAVGSEVAILAFSGGETSPIQAMCPLTRDPGQAEAFIQTLKAGGGTPLAAALREANRYLARSKSPNSKTQMIILLADGEGTGDATATLVSLKREGISFRHETIGLGIPAESAAARQLQAISKATGGGYHPASAPADVSRAFADAVAAQKLMDLVGKFGDEPSSRPQGTSGSQGLEDLLKSW